MSDRIRPTSIGRWPFKGDVSPSTVADWLQCTQPVLVDTRGQSSCEACFPPVRWCFIQRNNKPRRVLTPDSPCIHSPFGPILESRTHCQTSFEQIREYNEATGGFDIASMQVNFNDLDMSVAENSMRLFSEKVLPHIQ